MTPLETLALAMIALGAGFFAVGSIGLIRFPDLYSRLHALTKADNLGLALTALGVALLAGSWGEVAKLALVWFFVALGSATCGHLIARHARAAARRKAGR
jgi:multicomponent Na+:H+ antiporter subunit G